MKITKYLLLAIILGACGTDSSSEAEKKPITTTDPSGCDTTGLTYIQGIRPIIDQHCVACHNEALKSGGEMMADYAGLLHAIQNTNFVGSIMHTATNPMPPSYQLKECEIKKIHTWISQGAPR